jgi:hypothetical protein
MALIAAFFRTRSTPNGVKIFAMWHAFGINYHPIARSFRLGFC